MKTLLKSFVPERYHGQLKEAACRAYTVIYSGDRYQCPLCLRGFRRMIPRGLNHGVLFDKHVVGGGWRRDAFCPGCSSYDRERLVYLYLKNRTTFLSKPAKVLHIAPERILERLFRAVPGIDYTTGDLFSQVVDVKLDVTAIQFPDNTFDLTLCNHVMEHVPEDRQAMSEILRTLKPGGLAIIQTPISTVLTQTDEDLTDIPLHERIRRFGQEDHCRIYAMDYADRLKSVGFDVEIFRWEKSPEGFGGVENKYALNPEEPIFVCRKPAV